MKRIERQFRFVAASHSTDVPNPECRIVGRVPKVLTMNSRGSVSGASA